VQGAFIQSLTYQPPAILGRQMLPFSPWHGVILEAAGSPYVSSGKPNLDDMITAAWVCSHSFADGWAGASDVAGARKWGRRNRKSDLTAAFIEFSEHISASLVGPQYWNAEGGNSPKAPYWWHLATLGMSHLNLSDTAAWDYPISRLMCHFACKSEAEGNKDLMSSDDIKGMETLEADAKKAAKGKKLCP